MAQSQYMPRFDQTEQTQDKEFQTMMEPYTYIAQVPRQQLREILIRSLNHWMNLPTEKVELVKEILGMLYDYIVLLDDVLDDPELRRGIPATHKVYGCARTSIASNALLFLILDKLRAMNNPEVIRIYSEEMIQYFKGESQELYWIRSSVCPTEAEYLRVIEQKTESVIRFIIKLMQTFSDCKKDFTVLAKLLGLHYQFQNDYCNLHQEVIWKSKGFGEDISEGKCTIAVIHAAHSGTHDGEVVLNIIRQKTKNMDMQKHCMLLLEKLGSLDYAKRISKDNESQLREEIKRLGGNKILLKMLDTLDAWKNEEALADC